MTSLTAGTPTWQGGEELILAVPGAVAPIASIALTAPISAPAGGGLGGGYSLVQGQTIGFLPPLDSGTTSATLTVTDGAATTSPLTTPIFWPLYGSYTFALRSFCPVNWDVGPRTMADVPAGGETSPSNFAALTSGLAEGLNAFGGTPLTQMSADAPVGSIMFNVKHTAALPASGQVQIDQVLYSYSASSPGPTSPSLSGIAAALGGVSAPGSLAFHASQAQVAYVNSPVSDLVVLKNALFLDTAEGAFLTAIGRNLGVDHSPAVSGDDQYRTLVKAVAYGPKSSIYGVSLALDALLGAGTYTLREDPVGAPCTLFISVPYGALSQAGSFGRSYIQGLMIETPGSDGSVTLDVPPVGVGAVHPVANGYPQGSSDLALLTGQASTSTDSSPVTLAGASISAPLIAPDTPPLASDVGARVSLGGAVPGRFTVLAVRGGAWVVAQGVHQAVDLASSGPDLIATVELADGFYPETSGPFVYPRDIGRRVACQGQTGTLAAILDPITKTDLSTLATPLTQRSNVARVTGLRIGPQSAVPLAVVPVLPTASSVPYTAPRAYTLFGATLTRRVALASPPSQVAVAASTVLSAQVISPTETDTNVLPSGTLDQFPLYVDAPFAVLEAYLSDLTAAGVRPVLEYTD